MPSVPAQETHDLADFIGFLRRLEADGFDLAVIGGMAVSAYADLLGEACRSVDLDIYVTPETLRAVLEWAPRQGYRVVKRPRPRNIPVAFIDYDGKEVNVLAGYLFSVLDHYSVARRPPFRQLPTSIPRLP